MMRIWIVSSNLHIYIYIYIRLFVGNNETLWTNVIEDENYCHIVNFSVGENIVKPKIPSNCLFISPLEFFELLFFIPKKNSKWNSLCHKNNIRKNIEKIFHLAKLKKCNRKWNESLYWCHYKYGHFRSTNLRIILLSSI